MTSHSSRTDSGPGDAGIDWEAAWRRHARWLRTVIASRLPERDIVDDVLQQVALAATTGSHRPRDPTRVAPWLYRVAIRQCLMHRRTAGRRRRFVQRVTNEAAATDLVSAESPLEWLLREERLVLAQNALKELPELDRQLLLLKHTEHWTYQQLAERLGVSVNTIEYRLQAARARLRHRLQAVDAVEAIP
jgi:RNA polymerase sigma-70 factor (ECF subfamily)